MPQEKIEEETYSLIFRSLKHPIRRKILRILVDKQLAFSKILAILSMDSGHLSYHIENLGDLVKHTADGKYELSSIGVAAVNLMSGVEERPQLFTLAEKLRSKKIRNALMGAAFTILIVSVALNAYYYNSSQTLAGKIHSGTCGAASGFVVSLSRSTVVLESEAQPEDIDALVRYFMFYLSDAWDFLRVLKYLNPSYENSLLTIEDLLRDITVSGVGGVSDTFHYLSSNSSLKVIAFKELDLVASQKIFEMGLELSEAFLAIKTKEIFMSRLNNALLIANNLETILDEWITKYSQM
ncbi:MAG: ArsR/SmtB family transcription factor [Candidatus Hermodarchaeia archaeon]